MMSISSGLPSNASRSYKKVSQDQTLAKRFRFRTLGLLLIWTLELTCIPSQILNGNYFTWEMPSLRNTIKNWTAVWVSIPS